MLALYRGERQADALAAYRRARAMLASELGLEPGEELRGLEQAVLRQKVPAAGAAPPAQPAGAADQLPGPRAGTGRAGKLLGQARLITLTGAAGVGKTRLAVELPRARWTRFPHGVWLADLAGIADPGLVALRVMEALGVRQDGDVPVIDALRYRLRAAELLLVLDNCEHLLDACAELAGALLGGSPGLRVLATSREPLGVPGEVTYPVPPLALPPDPADAAAIAWAPRGAAVPGPLIDRPGAGPGGGLRRWRRSPGSAASWTACRWRSSWPPRGPARCRWRRSRRTWRTSSPSWPTGGRSPTRATRR